MNNKQVIEDFINGFESKTKNLFSEREGGKFVLYSYGYHFPLCIKLNDCFVVNSNSYSKTTACHKGLIVRMANKKIIYKNTEELKNIIQSNVLYEAELIEQEI